MEGSGGVEAGDGEVGHGGDGVEGLVLRELLLDLADFPSSGGGAENQIHFLLPGLRNRHGGFDGLDGSEDRGKRVEDCKKGVHGHMLVPTGAAGGGKGSEFVEGKGKKGLGGL